MQDSEAYFDTSGKRIKELHAHETIIVAIAGVLFLAPLTLAGVAQATTPSGATSTTLGRISLGPYHETSPSFKLFAKDPTDTVVTTTTIAPAAPPAGTLTPARPSSQSLRERSPSTTVTTRPARRTHTDPAPLPRPGPGHVHIARNEGTTPVTVVSIYLNAPPGGSQRIDAPALGNCPF